MAYFKDLNGGLHFLSDADISNGGELLLPAGCVQITDEEATSMQTANNKPTTAQLWTAYQQQAQAALDKSDVTVLRCYENAVALPAAWGAYRKALRAIVGAATGDPTQPLPTMPTYPTGT